MSKNKRNKKVEMRHCPECGSLLETFFEQTGGVGIMYNREVTECTSCDYYVEKKYRRENHSIKEDW